MYKISKEDIKNAFLTGQRKRNKMLYEYYKEEYFSRGYTARMIAAKLSEDLGVPISDNMIFKIYSRIIKQKKLIPDISNQPTQTISQESEVETSGREMIFPEKIQKEFVFKNSDDEPKKNPFEDAFIDL